MKSLYTYTLLIAVTLASPIAHADLFDFSVSRGIGSPVKYTSPGSVSEVCIIPKPFPGTEYSEKEFEKFSKLCTIDFYGKAGENQEDVVASCPALYSTNPAVHVEIVPQGTSVDSYVKNECKKETDRSGEKFAKFKQSISCSYAPSILTYPQLAEFLGGSIEIPAAVVRTMDISEHKKITAFALKYAKDTIAQTWTGFKNAENSPSSYSKRERIFSKDFKQIYGALSKNPRGEEKYTEINGQSKLLSSQAWSDAKNPNSARKFLGSSLKGAAQRVTAMKDVANMIILDHIMGQQDRLGNIHVKEYFYKFNASTGELEKRQKDDNDQAAPDEVAVKELLLKDNDCGMRGSEDNIMKKLGLVAQIRHLAPKNYKNLLKFGELLRQSDMATYLKTEMLMTSDDIKLLQNNTADVIKTLQSACKKGTLKLDADLEGHLRGDPVETGCDG